MWERNATVYKEKKENNVGDFKTKKFSKGDKVQVTRLSGFGPHSTEIGDTGEVVQTLALFGDYRYHVKMDKDGRTLSFGAEELGAVDKVTRARRAFAEIAQAHAEGLNSVSDVQAALDLYKSLLPKTYNVRVRDVAGTVVSISTVTGEDKVGEIGAAVRVLNKNGLLLTVHADEVGR